MLAAVAQAAPLRVSVLLAEEGGAYREFAESFTVEAARHNLQWIVSQGSSLPANSDLIVAVGIKSTVMALNGRTSVLSVLVSRASIEKLLGELKEKRDKNTFSAIYIDQPSKRQIALLDAILPKAENVGLLFASQSAEITELHKLFERSRFSLVAKKLESTESLHHDLHTLLKKSDVLFSIPDSQIYNSSTLRNILLETFRANIPVIGFSPSFVKAGALCAVFSTSDQIARQAAKTIQLFAETASLPAEQYPTEFDVMVNKQVARSLGIPVLETTVLVRKIKAASTAAGG